MERAFNDVWSVEKARSLHRRIGDYLSVLILGPVLAFAVLAVTASLHDYIFSKTIINIPLIETFIDKVTPYITSWVVFCFLYIFIPNTKVRFPSALYGAVIAGTVWQLLNFIFSRFIVTSYQSGAKAALYASFAVFPLFLVWLYFSWTIVLSGAEIAYVHQNRKKITWEKRTKRVSWQMEESVALKIMLIISQKFCQNERAPTLSDLADYLQIPEQAIDKVLAILIDLELVYAIGPGEERFAPAKCLEALSLREIMVKLRTYGIPDPTDGRDDAISRLVEEVKSQTDQALKQTFKDITLRALLDEISEEHNE
jgi:membrane protein